MSGPIDLAPAAFIVCRNGSWVVRRGSTRTPPFAGFRAAAIWALGVDRTPEGSAQHGMVLAQTGVFAFHILRMGQAERATAPFDPIP